MVMRLQPGEFKPVVKILTKFEPVIQVSKIAHDKMSRYVDCCKFEIGWMGTARKLTDEEETYLIEDVFLFKQDVGNAHTNAKEGALIELAENLTSEQMENLRFWGHSHVNMECFFSGTDFNNMTTTFYDGGRTDWYVGAVCNKKGQIKFYMFFPERGIEIADVPWDVVDPDEDAINETYKAQIREFCTYSASTYYQTNAKFPEQNTSGGKQGKKHTGSNGVETGQNSSNIYQQTKGASFTIKKGLVQHFDSEGQPLKLFGDEAWVEGMEKDRQGRDRHYIYTARGKWISSTGVGWILLENAQELAKQDKTYAAMFAETEDALKTAAEKAVEDFMKDDSNLGSKYDRFKDM